jgi:hypothetical protein
MHDNSAGIDALFHNADDPAWRALMETAEASATIKRQADCELYAVVFGTPAGRLVLEDMYNRYVNVTRCVPGQGADAAFYREGMAQVVFDIVHNINSHEKDLDND